VKPEDVPGELLDLFADATAAITGGAHMDKDQSRHGLAAVLTAITGEKPATGNGDVPAELEGAAAEIDHLRARIAQLQANLRDRHQAERERLLREQLAGHLVAVGVAPDNDEQRDLTELATVTAGLRATGGDDMWEVIETTRKVAFARAARIVLTADLKDPT
jgi:hypothetical protein